MLRCLTASLPGSSPPVERDQTVRPGFGVTLPRRLRPRPKLARLCGLAAALALAVACGSDDSSDFEAGPLGAVEVGPGEDIQIRSMLTVVVEGAFGLPALRAVEFAVEDYGPVAGRTVNMDLHPDGCSEEGGRAAALAVVDDPQVVGVIGPSCSNAATSAGPIISEAGLVMLSPSATSPFLTSDLRGNAAASYNPGFYRTANNDFYGALAVARFAHGELGLRQMAVIHDGGPYTSGMAEAFAADFEDLGGATATYIVSKGDTDMTGVLSEISVTDADGLFFPLFITEGTLVVLQAAQISELADVVMIGGSAMLESELLEIPEVVGMYFESPVLDLGGRTNEATGKSLEDVIAVYEDRYGESPVAAYGLTQAYDATTMLLRAVEEVAVADDDTVYIDRARLREALNSVEGFAGLVGTISCDDFGDCSPARANVVRHTDPAAADITELPIVYQFQP